MILLSVIVPFHNSASKCSRLLDTIIACKDNEIEVILVDDGSTDGTSELLSSAISKAEIHISLHQQVNKGPGGARNTGLAAARGEYIWFVDSDDNMDLHAAAIELRSHSEQKFDFIDFKIDTGDSVHRSIGFDAGYFVVSSENDYGHRLFDCFGRLWSKIFSRRLFDKYEITYPEFCIYEDNPVGLVLPLVTKNFLVSDRCVYFHYEDAPSVTRGIRSDRHFDRLYTSFLGWGIASRICEGCDQFQDSLRKKLIKLALFNTSPQKRSGPGAWFQKARICAYFRRECQRRNLEYRQDMMTNAENMSPKRRLLFVSIWLVSMFLPDQSGYFDKKRLKAWGRRFESDDFVDVEKARLAFCSRNLNDS